MRIPPSFLLKLGRFLLFMALEALCVYMICNNGIVQRYRLVGRFRDLQAFFWEKRSDIREYSRLKQINGELARDNRRLMGEIDRLKQAAPGSPGDTVVRPFSYINAKVIKNTVNTVHNYLILDKGYKDGIREDMGVITPQGAIGITRAVTDNFAYVLSFLNAGQQISAKIGGTEAFGPLSWDLSHPDRAVLNEIPQHLKIMPGDTVYTSGYSSFYPPDIPVGTALDSRLVNGTHLCVEVQLLQEFRQLSHVMVVVNNHRKEIDFLQHSQH